MGTPGIVVAQPADLLSRVGEHVGWSEWHTVTQAEIDHFAEATGNRAPIHVDPEFAKQTPYGGTIAFGMQIQAMTTFLLSDIWDLRATGGADVGSNKVRHLAPVIAGGRVRLGVVIAAAEEVAPNGVRTTMDLTFEVEGSERPACVAEVVYIYSFPEDSTVTPSP
jgi:acyl dehydratase